MTEYWKTISINEDYEISNLGNVKSLPKDFIRKDGKPFHKKERIMVNGNHRKGYKTIGFRVNGKWKSSKIHRLMAIAFLPIPEHLKDYSIDDLQVDHINGKRDDNWIELKEDENGNLIVVNSNLRWCTNKENTNFELAKRNKSESRKGKRLKPLIQLTKTGEFVREWASALEVHRQLGYDRAGISLCCNGKLKTYKDSIWRFK